MATIHELRKIRLKKLEAIKKAGIPVYPARTRRTHKISEALESFSALVGSKKEIILSGRIRSLREHGGSTFCHIEDSSSSIQAFFKKDRIGERGYKFFLDNFDIGDFIEVRGILFKTKRGEKTIESASFKMLAKSLLPLPEKWHGLQDVEARYRQRYLDLIVTPKVRETFAIRSQVLTILRDFFLKRDFFEVETPMMHPIPGGAAAKPFVTHHNKLDQDLYLRIAPELYLKRLVVGGLERVFEVGRNFRNEGISTQHNPEFTMLEFYQAYANYEDLMKLTEELLEAMVKKIHGQTEIVYQDTKLSFKAPFPRLTMAEAVKKFTKKPPAKLSAEAMLAAFEEEVEPKLIQPTFVTQFPTVVSPLARRNDQNPEIADRFELFIYGREIANGFNELNDPEDQAARFQEQVAAKDKGNEEAMHYDADYIQALEVGLPPTAGEGIGIDRLVMLLTDSPSIRDVILFPQLRSK